MEELRDRPELLHVVKPLKHTPLLVEMLEMLVSTVTYSEYKYREVQVDAPNSA